MASIRRRGSSHRSSLRQPDAPQQICEARIYTHAIPNILVFVERSERAALDSTIEPGKCHLIVAERGVDLGNVVRLAEAGSRQALELFDDLQCFDSLALRCVDHACGVNQCWIVGSLSFLLL